MYYITTIGGLLEYMVTTLHELRREIALEMRIH